MTSLNEVRKRRLTAKETSIANCEVFDRKYRIAVQGVFVDIIIKAGGASLKVKDLFAFTFCKKYKPGKLVLAVCCLLISINKFSELFRPAEKQQQS